MISLTAHAADSADNVNLNAGTDLGTGANAAANYSTGSAPTTSNDMTFLNGTYTNLSFNLSGGAITPGTLDDLDTTQAISITDSLPNSITLSSNPPANATPGSSPSDLLYVASGGNLTIAAPVVLGAAGNFDIAGSGVADISGVISGGSGIGFTKTGAGTLTLNGSLVNTYTGNTVVNSGTLVEDFTNIGATPNLINSGSVLNMGGGTLQIFGNGSNASSQAFASTAFNSGANIISAAPGSGANNPTLALGTIAFTASTVQFVGPATINSSGNVAATATITTSAGGTGNVGQLISGAGAAYATVGLYDWASTDTTGGTAGTTIIGGSQVTGFYTALAGGGTVGSSGKNYDVTGATAASSGGSTYTTDNLRFNTNIATTFSVSTAKNWQVEGILVTPNVGVNNVTFTNSGSGANGLNHNNSNPLVIFQNNTSGELIFNTTYYYGILGSGSYIQSGPGTVFQDGINGNDYTGATYLNGGVTEIGPNLSGPAGGPAGQLGAGTGASLNVNLNGGTLIGDYTGNLDGASSAHPVVLGNNGGGLGAVTGTTLTVDGVVSGAAGTGPLVIGIPVTNGSNGAPNNGNVVGQLPGTGGSSPTSSVLANGTVVLSSTSNTYTGGTVLDSGILQFAGSGSSVNTAVFGAGGITLNGGTFQWASGNTTDISGKTITFMSNGGTLDTNGNTVALANPIGNGSTGGFTKAGAGTLTLNGANTYTGNTTVSAGTLAIGSTGSLGNTAILVASAATFAATPGSGNITLGTTGASLNLNAGSSFSLADNAIDTLTLNSVGGGTGTVLTLGGTTTTPTSLTFDLGSAGADELIANNGTISFAGSAKDNISINPLGSTAPGTLANIPLLSVPNGTLTLADFVLSPTSSTIPFGSSNYTASLSLGAGNTQLLLTLTQIATSLDFYWKGGTSGSWATTGPTNFATDHTGATLQTAAPGSANNVYETADSAAHFSQTLDGSYTINSLSFTGGSTGAASNSITLANGAGTNTLTINASNTFTDANSHGYAVGTGLVVQSGSAAHTISANLILGSSQTWEIDNIPANALTVSGNIDDGGSNFNLTETGSGGLILSGTNTYGGLTTVSNGALTAATDSALGSSTASTAGLSLNPSSSTATVNFTSATPAIASLASSGAGASSVVLGNTVTPAATILMVGGNNVSTNFGGVISDANTGAGAIGNLTKVGTGALTLSNANTYTGLTTVSSGTLVASNDAALGSSTASTAGLLLNPSSGTATVNFTSATPAIASLTNSGAGTSSVVLGNATTPATTTLTVGGNNTSTNFGGVISDLNSTTELGNLALIGTGTLTLSGANTYHGTTTIGSLATLVVANTNALQSSTVDFSNGALNFDPSITAANFGNLTGTNSAQNLVLSNTAGTPAAVALTLGGTNANHTYSGNLSGLGSVTKNGSATLTLANANYTGNTTVNTGAFNVTGGSFGSSTSTFAVQGNSGSVQTAAATVSGGTLNAGQVNIGTGSNQFGATLTINGTANATFATGVNIGAAGDTAGSLTINTSGSVSLGAAVAARDGGAGLVIQNGTVTATSMDVQGAGVATAGNANLQISNGSLTIGNSSSTGAFKVGDATGGTGHGGTLTMSGGQLTYLGTDGLLAANGGGTTPHGNVTITGGIANLTGVTLNAGNIAGDTSLLAVSNGATLYLGSVGLVLNPGGGNVSATFGTATIGALADWSSLAPITLGTAGTVTTFQAADASNVAHNISLSGSLTGAGGLTKTGGGTLTISGANQNYGGSTTVNAGTLAIDTSGSITASAVQVNSTALLSFNAETGGAGPYARQMFGINLTGGNAAVALASPQNTNRSVVVVGGASSPGLTTTSGTLDLSNNDMLLQTTSASGGTAGLLATANQVAQGFNVGNTPWSGTTGIISSAAAANSQHSTGIAVEINDVNYSQALVYGPVNPPSSPAVIVNPSFSLTNPNTSLGGGSGLFDNQTTNDGDVLVKYTYFGDTNLDGVVDASDYLAVDSAYNSNQAILANPGANPNAYLMSGWANGDFNYDGLINGDDYTLMDNAFNSQAGVSYLGASAGPANMIAGDTEQIAGATSSAAVPEPASVSLIAFGAIGLLKRRRRRRGDN